MIWEVSWEVLKRLLWNTFSCFPASGTGTLQFRSQVSFWNKLSVVSTCCSFGLYLSDVRGDKNWLPFKWSRAPGVHLIHSRPYWCSIHHPKWDHFWNINPQKAYIYIYMQGCQVLWCCWSSNCYFRRTSVLITSADPFLLYHTACSCRRSYSIPYLFLVVHLVYSGYTQWGRYADKCTLQCSNIYSMSAIILEQQWDTCTMVRKSLKFYWGTFSCGVSYVW